jgi:hypothetical protein
MHFSTLRDTGGSFTGRECGRSKIKMAPAAYSFYGLLATGPRYT